MQPVHVPEPDSFWSALRRALESRRESRRRHRLEDAAAIVASCWPDRRPGVRDAGKE